MNEQIVGALSLMEQYRAAKEKWERLVAECAADTTDGLMALRDHAERRVNRLKAFLGDGQPGDPLCCQRYGRLHLPEFAVPGCRWYPSSPAQGEES